MAAKKGNGHDPATKAIVEVLERIEKRLGNVETEARATNERLDKLREEVHEDLAAVRADVASVRSEVTSLRAETRAELGLLREEVHELHGEMKGSLERRVAKLEAVVFRPTGT